tara:strand:+ start:59 stop:586 length:528 start_codon:yes stop_codon:yes gene_type:complete
MGSEYFINSQELEDKIRQLLPSQGGAGAGFDLSASTQIIPIIDLTESAEGSNLRQDLQASISHGSATVFSVTNAKTTVINNTGYWRIIGGASINNDASTGGQCNIILSDGTTEKIVWGIKNLVAIVNNLPTVNVDYTVFLSAGDSIIIQSGNTESNFVGSIRQIATIDGVLVDPS